MGDTLDVGALLGTAPLRGPLGAPAPAPTPLVGNGDAVVAFYASAHWCPPCRAFTPALAAAYLKLLQRRAAAAKKDDGDGDGAGGSGDEPPPPPPFEVVFVSADRTRAQFEAGDGGVEGGGGGGLA